MNSLMKFILENPHKPWNWIVLSDNPNVTMTGILALLSKEEKTKEPESLLLC